MRSTPSAMPSQKGLLTASGTGKARSVTAQHRRGCGREHPTGSVGKGHPGAIHLTRSAFPPQLAGGLDQREDAVHAGVAVRQPAPVGVEWELAARGRSLATHEVTRLAAAAEPERFQGQQYGDREAVV